MKKHKDIVGRIAETSTLKRLYNSKKSEFAIVYGRRRVGKTFVVAKTFEKDFTFRMTALSKGTTKEQLQNFHNYLTLFDPKAEGTPIPKNWLEAFQILIKFLSRQSVKRKVIFFDELPWFDSHGSDFLKGLEHFWNGWAAYRSDCLLYTSPSPRDQRGSRMPSSA